MLVYILKSAACLAILFVFYKLFLEKESIHKFKRFYLLGALVFSLLVPALVFTEYVEVAPPTEVTYAATQPIQLSEDVISVPMALEADVLDIEPVLWGVYFLGLFFFGLKFIRNLFQIFKRIRRNPKFKLNRFTQVLLQEKITPHTFFSYIFLNRTKFESKQIPKEVLLHEETHALQKHSWDVVFVELLQVIFWVNPFIYFAKKAIKLNHEFLADQAVLQNNIDETTYKNTLLSYLSPDSEEKYQPLANAINYSSIKKRFTIMKTHTSKKVVLLRSLFLLPMLALMLYGFSETKTETIVVDPVNKTIFETKLTKEAISNRTVELAGLILDTETLKPLENVEIYDTKGNHLVKTDERGYYQVQFDDLGEGEIRFEYSLNKKGYKSVTHSEHWGNLQGKIEKVFYFGLSKKESNTPEFSQHISSNNLSYESVQNNFYLVQNQFEFDKKLNNAKKGNRDVLIEIDKVHYLVNQTGWIKINSKEDLISIDDNLIVPASKVNGILERTEITGMTPLGKNKTALFAIYTIPVNSAVIPIKGASKAEIKEYDRLSKKYNAVPIEKRKIPLTDLKVLEIVFKKMTVKQKHGAQPFPECLPKNSQDGASRKLMAEYDTLARKYNTMLAESKSIQIKKKDVDRLEYIYGLMSDKQKADAEPFPDFPEPPPPPKAPKPVKALKVKKGVKSNIPPPPPAPSNLSDEAFAEKVIDETIANQDPYDHSNYKYTIINGEVNKEWMVSSGANRDSRTSNNQLPIPPVAPTIAIHANTNNYSKELKISISQYLEKNKAYEESIEAYSKKGKGNRQELWDSYNEAMELYVAYYDLARKEDNFVQPMPPIAPRVLKGEVSEIPTPPTPPEPKSPLDHIIEMAKEGAIFKYKGKTISSDKAIDLLKKDNNLSISTKKRNNETPIVKISKSL